MTRFDADPLIAGDGPQDPQKASGRMPGEHTPAPPGADGFQRALDFEQRAFCDALTIAPRALQERLTPLLTDLYTILRTPIFPKGGYRALAEALVQTSVRDHHSVYLYGVLASPTAATEMDSFVHCAALFKRHGFVPHLRLFLVRWEDLIGVPHRDAVTRARTFAQQVRRVTEAARHAGFADVVIPVDVEVDIARGEIVSPLDFREWWQRVAEAADDPRRACPSLVRDVVWSTGFYARQASLSRLGEKQPLLDLAIRRAIGKRISAEHATHPQRDGRVVAMLTAELHKRFLPCYAASVPIVNLDARKRAGAAATLAVA